MSISKTKIAAVLGTVALMMTAGCKQWECDSANDDFPGCGDISFCQANGEYKWTYNGKDYECEDYACEDGEAELVIDILTTCDLSKKTANQSSVQNSLKVYKATKSCAAKSN